LNPIYDTIIVSTNGGVSMKKLIVVSTVLTALLIFAGCSVTAGLPGLAGGWGFAIDWGFATTETRADGPDKAFGELELEQEGAALTGTLIINDNEYFVNGTVGKGKTVTLSVFEDADASQELFTLNGTYNGKSIVGETTDKAANWIAERAL